MSNKADEEWNLPVYPNLNGKDYRTSHPVILCVGGFDEVIVLIVFFS